MPTVKATKGTGTKAYNRYAYYLAMANGVDTRVPNRTRNRLAAERRKKEEERYLECARLCIHPRPRTGPVRLVENSAEAGVPKIRQENHIHRNVWRRDCSKNP